MPESDSLAQRLEKLGSEKTKITVQLSHEIVHLLSSQLYKSPLKAIEELVVNCYDANAKYCKIWIPSAIDLNANLNTSKIAIFDDGSGMDIQGLTDLWHIGHSNKRTEELTKRLARKQIGKFGIGKLATYTIANKLTYITRSAKGIYSVSIDFRDFKNDVTGKGAPLLLSVREFDSWKTIANDPAFSVVQKATGVTTTDLEKTSWTFAVLEDLTEKAADVRAGRLEWVLRTAMPLKSGFEVILNAKPLPSSKEGYKRVAEFALKDLPESRLRALNEKTHDNWRIDGNLLISNTFKSGTTGTVFITEKSLPGKSDDILRSHGFFIRVRERLINEEDPLFGVGTVSSFETLNRFRADIDADDLDVGITVPREGIEASALKKLFEVLLTEVYAEARKRYEEYIKGSLDIEKRKKEHARSFVAPQLVEYPIADVLINKNTLAGAEPDGTWFYLEIPSGIDCQRLAATLYSEPRSKFKYEYVGSGEIKRLLKFNPETSTFYINRDHKLVVAYGDDKQSQLLLEDFVAAEVLLEVQLRLANISPGVIGEILEKRDVLLRSLAEDHPYSQQMLAKHLRDSVTDEHDLEIAVVAASRALGFVAKHISGDGEPDGIARYIDYPGGETIITLEAKSSKSVPSLSAIDFAGLREHATKYNASGCLLVCPAYPGGSRGEESAAAARAEELKISCWTIEQLAAVVSASESHHFTTEHILNIVLKKFSPDNVKVAIEQLFAAPTIEMPPLYNSIVIALGALENRMMDKERTLDMVFTEVTRDTRFIGLKTEVFQKAVADIVSFSQGGLRLSGEKIGILVSLSELRRRLHGANGEQSWPVRLSKFRNDFSSLNVPEEH